MSAITPNDLKSRAGRILYRELPEEYRYRDSKEADGEPGDLEAFLHGAGHLLDLVRGTTEQAYADAFAEEVDGRSIQTWLVPYLAELVGADLLAPDPEQRIEELNNSVLWYKSKGTLRTADEIADVVSGTETVTREGWRYVLTTPRMDLPPFARPPLGVLSENDNNKPAQVKVSFDAMSGRNGYAGCPDFRVVDRAVLDPGGANPLYRLKYPARNNGGHEIEPTKVYWKPLNPGGVPAFPGHYDDNSARCPDMREVRLDSQIGPHPRRSIIHVRPPQGLFEKGLRTIAPNDLTSLGLDGQERLTPQGIMTRLGLLADGELAPEKIKFRLKSDMEIVANARITFENILFVGPGRIIVKTGGLLGLNRCAVKKIVLEPAQNLAGSPAMVARNSIFAEIVGGDSFAEMEYCTVTGPCDLARVNASDCIFVLLSDNLSCSMSDAQASGDDKPRSCIRFSRVEFAGQADKLRACFLSAAPANTSDSPRFIRLWFKNQQGVCRLRLPTYGEPGYGVLDTATPQSILNGAEQEGEMGAGHALFQAAGLSALAKKLEAFLPLGQEIAFFYDPMLALMPPELQS